MKQALRILLLVALAGVLAIPLSAQDNAVTITLAVSDFSQDAFETAVAEFEAQHPNIKVQIVPTNANVASASNNLESHLSDLEDYASSADVLLVSQDTVSLAGTQAGYFLNLSPLTSADPTLNADDFVPQAWQSFQWDRGVWALPLTVDVYILVYDPTAFDEAGLPYPDPSWTLDDFAFAVRTLTTTDADGEVQGAFFDFGTSEYLFRSLLGSNLADTNADPIQPMLENPDLAQMLTTWAELRSEGAVSGLSGGASFFVIGGGAEDGPPMSIQRSFALASPPGGNNPNQTTSVGTLLPGGSAGLEVQGIAISSGTLYPEQAYELAKFLTFSPDVVNSLFGSIPARNSLAGVEPTSDDSGPGRNFNIQLSPENQALVDQALSQAASASDMLFFDYVNSAISLMESDGLDATSALSEVEAQAVADVQTAADTNAAVIVATPVPEVVLAPGEISLNFGMVSFIRGFSDENQWTDVVNDFVASDPVVGQVVVDTPFDTAVDTLAEAYDCFYLPTNSVSADNVSSLINLDPFLDTDLDFDENDIIGNVMSQLQFDNKTWAYPITVQPEILRYDSDILAMSGVPAPESGWTVDAFVDALQRINDATGETPFVPGVSGSDYIMSLIIAFGGLPLDYRTDPPAINFTNPASVEAIRQVLDLAKSGLIEYNQLGTGSGPGRAIFSIGGGDSASAITTFSLNALNILQNRQDGATNFGLTTYPSGSQYTPIAYDIGTGYISANTQSPDACYSWLKTISRHTELFSAMPASRSLATTLDPQTANLYDQVDNILQQPGVIEMPSGFGNARTIWPQNWLNRAFDRYVLEDADLDLELSQAEAYAKEYQTCIDNIAPLTEGSIDEQRQYFQQFQQCATSVDPTIG
ncbi:MAG: extracellular solute-binding protein [Anaerolineae bacterium]|nr:extracellular solute-binding protein [Anaerolineae bacterium]